MASFWNFVKIYERNIWQVSFGYFFLTTFFHMIYNHFEKGLQKSGSDKILARTHLPVKLLPYLLNTVYPTGSCTYPYNFKILYPILNFRYDMFTRYVLITTHIIYYMIRYNKLCFKTTIAIHQNEIHYFLIWIRWHAS